MNNKFFILLLLCNTNLVFSETTYTILVDRESVVNDSFSGTVLKTMGTVTEKPDYQKTTYSLSENPKYAIWTITPTEEEKIKIDQLITLKSVKVISENRYSRKYDATIGGYIESIFPFEADTIPNDFYVVGKSTPLKIIEITK